MSDAQSHAAWLSTTVGVRRRDDLALIRVYDEDRRSWLNGQITNDISKLEPGGGVYALTVNLRGKILADLWVFDRGEELVLVVPKSARASLLAHYDRYIVMEDVEVEPLDGLVVLTAQGPRARDLDIDGGHFANRLSSGGFDLLVSANDVVSQMSALVAQAKALGGGEVDEAGWEEARILAGVPRFGVDFGDATLPQEAGLADRAVSFVKGCYLGQEVVCMLENRGKLRRRLVNLEAEAELTVGGSIDLDGKSLGTVTSALFRDGEARALGLLKAKASQPGTVLDVGGVPVVVRSAVGG
ncbi:MAG: folate-binding protein YgfZ [Sandaracinaceae bacterium]